MPYGEPSLSGLRGEVEAPMNTADRLAPLSRVSYPLISGKKPKITFDSVASRKVLEQLNRVLTAGTNLDSGKLNLPKFDGKDAKFWIGQFL